MKRLEITVSVQWRAAKAARYATLRWREPTADGSTTRRERYLGQVSEDQAAEARAALEAELRLGLAQPVSVTSYSAGDLLLDYLHAVEASPTGDKHKDRVAQDAANLARHLGEVRADLLGAQHVGRYLAMRSRERVVRARQRERETAAAWAQRQAQARLDPEGETLSSRTILGEVATLRRAMRWGRDAGLLTVDPVPLPHRKALPKTDRPARRLTEGEVSALVAAAAGTDRQTLVEVLAWSGRRPRAIFALTVGDCARLVEDLPREQQLVYWRADKGGEGRGWGPVTEPAWRALRRRLDELAGAPASQLLWTTPSGQAWASTTWPRAFGKVAAAAGVENVTSYDLRKHACAQILQATGNAHLAIRFTGHRTVEMLLRAYAYALEGQAEGAAARIDWTPRPLELVKAAGGNAGGSGQGGGGEGR